MINKRGQTLFLGIITAIVIFMLGMTIVNLIKPEVTNARSSTGLDCTNSSISDGTKLTCLAVDITIPYFFIAVLSVAGGLIVSRLAL